MADRVMVCSDEGWKLARRKKDTVVHYKYEDGSSLVTTKAATILPVEDRSQIPNEFVKLVSLFNESDLMPKYVLYCMPISLQKS